MMKKCRSMCDSMMSDMGGMDAMMAKGKSMCDNMMGSSSDSSRSSDSSSCSSDTGSNSCNTSKNTTFKQEDECSSSDSCKL